MTQNSLIPRIPDTVASPLTHQTQSIIRAHGYRLFSLSLGRCPHSVSLSSAVSRVPALSSRRFQWQPSVVSPNNPVLIRPRPRVVSRDTGVYQGKPLSWQVKVARLTRTRRGREAGELDGRRPDSSHDRRGSLTCNRENSSLALGGRFDVFDVLKEARVCWLCRQPKDRVRLSGVEDQAQFNTAAREILRVERACSISVICYRGTVQIRWLFEKKYDIYREFRYNTKVSEIRQVSRLVLLQ